MRLFIFLSLVFLLGCGTASDPVDLSNTTVEDSKALVVRGGKEGINYIISEDKRKVRYLGEIENNGNQTFCFIDITFNTKGADGHFIDLLQGTTRQINGFTLSNFGTEINSCLKPGQFGSFNTGDVVITQDFADFDYRICFRRNGICEAFPLAKEPRVHLSFLRDSQLDIDINGFKQFRGQIKNDSDQSSDPNAIAYNVAIIFTVLSNDGKVIDTVSSDVLTASQPCPDNSKAKFPFACIYPQGSTNTFTVTTKVRSSEICEGCFYFRVYHSE